MAKRLTIISEYSDETATDILEILEANEISYYITPAGGWVQSLEALWLNNDNDFNKANTLLSKYFRDKAVSRSSDNAYLEGEAYKNTIQRLLSNPTTFALVIPTIIIVLLMVFLLS